MEENSSAQRNNSALVSGRQLRLLLTIIFFGLLLTSAYSNWLVSTYSAKMLLCSISLCGIGFIMGFRPHSEDKQIRQTFFFAAVFMPCTMLIGISGELISARKYPADGRCEILLRQPFLCTFLLLASLLLSSFFVAKAAFRRLYPEKAVLPVTPEEREQFAPPPPELRLALRRYMISIFLIMLPALVSVALFPKYSIKIMLASASMMLCFMSYICGVRWDQVKPISHRFSLVLGIIGPMAGFVGFYGASKAHDAVHLVKALLFSGGIAVCMWVPFLVVRFLNKSRRG